MTGKKIALIGGGQIGGILALLAAQKELGDIVIYDIPDKEGQAKGKALDITELAPAENRTCSLRGTSNPEDLKEADLVIVTAGVPRKPGMSREDLKDINARIITDIAGKVKEYCPDSFNIIITNPLDTMVYLFKQITGFPKERVVGMAGVLDSSRFRAFVAMELNVSVESVAAIVLGGHGPAMLPLPRLCTVGGLPLTELMSGEKIDQIVQRTRDAGAELVKLYGNGSAFFSTAAAAITMAESYLKDQRKVLPCAAFCEGEYGISGYYIGVPVIIGAGGAEKILELKLTGEEKKALSDTLETVKKSVSTIE